MQQDAQPETTHPPSRLSRTWHDLREVLGISFPIIVAMASHTLMGFVDRVMLGHYGPDELAAAGAAGGVAFTVIAFVFGATNCTSTFVAQSIGRGQHEECARYTWQGMYFGLTAQVLVIPIALTAPLIFWAFGHEAELQPLECTYFRIRMSHVAATAAYAALSSFFQGIGRPGIPMVTAIVANLFNILLDYLLIFGRYGFPEMGIEGAAIATSVASYLQAALLLGAFLSWPMHKRFKTRTHARLDLPRLRRLLRIGTPAGLNFMLDVGSWTIFTNILIGRLGRNILAASIATGSIISLSFLPAVGINKGITVLVGKYIGRKDIPAAKRRAYAGLALAVGYMVFMGVVFVLFRASFIGLFITKHSGLDAVGRATMLEAGSKMLILAAVFQAFDGLCIVCYGALRGAGDTRFPAIVCVCSAWTVLLPLGYVLTYPAGLGYVGAWTAAAIHIAIVGIILFWRFASEAWRKIDIFQGTDSARADEE